MLQQFELAGCLTPEVYEACIPKECSWETLAGHEHGLGLCWGLVKAIECGGKMDCSECDESKINRAEQRAKRSLCE